MKRNAIQTWEAAACQRSFAGGMVTGAMITGLGAATLFAPLLGWLLGLTRTARTEPRSSGTIPE